ncbi:fimbria/pilus outer membrane usher protein [Escherichia coli]|nr:fimbria/pilus outer membrane usher protein [Escherichia coli]
MLDTASLKKNYMTMSEYLDANDDDRARTGNDKEMYTVTYNQNFTDARVSVYLNYSHHTYWDRQDQTNYNMMLSHYFNLGKPSQLERFSDRLSLRIR